MRVFYARHENVISVQDNKNVVYDIPITDELKSKLKAGATISVICIGLEGGKPSFALAPQYYKTKKVVNCGEGQMVEFKSSIIFSPETEKPDSRQPLQIAKEIAAFANSDGGTLYLGVDDKGRLVGIEKDLPNLKAAELKNGDFSDCKHSYSQNNDGYALKLHALIRVYLGEVADTLVDGDPQFVKDEDCNLTYVILKIRASDSVIYWGEYEDVCYRSGSATVVLRGRGRDEYIKRRFYDRKEQNFTRLLKQYQDNERKEQEELKKQLQTFNEALATGKFLPPKTVVAGTAVQFQAGSFVKLSEADAFLAVDTPRAIIYKPNSPETKWRAATNWKEFYAGLLEILAEIYPNKFEGLPEEQIFKRRTSKAEPYFLRKGSRRKLSSCSDYLGPNQDIRANLGDVSKRNFLNDKALQKRVIDYFGVALDDLAVQVN